MASRLAVSLLIAFLAAMAYFAVGEVIVRIATHSPLLEYRDFRAARGERNNLNAAIEYESTVGWVLRPGVKTETFNTIEHGLRSNGGGAAVPRQGGVLAVGSSFTAGSEVSDAETWPAQLEQLTGLPVNNAGVGNYSADQIIMRAEQLLPVLKPKVIVVDLLADNILGVTYSSYAFPKPYFLIENGELIAHHQPVPPPQDVASASLDIKSLSAHSILIDRFMAAFFSDTWYSSSRGGFIRTNEDEVDITCRLLDRLKRKLDAANVRLILYLQFAGSHVIGQQRQPGHTSLVKECSESFGIHVVDEFAGLKATFEQSSEDLRRYYVTQTDGSTGHKSKFGNLQVAKLVQDAISDTTTRARTRDPRLDTTAVPIGKVKNLILNSDTLYVAPMPPHAQLACQTNWIPGATTYRLKATGAPGEHYFSIGGLSLPKGPLIASFEVKAESTSRVRIVLTSSSSSEGVLADFDLENAKASSTRIGEARGLGTDIESVRFGWYRVWVRATFAEDHSGSIILQLADRGGATGFEPKGESVLLRKVQVTRGDKVAAYSSEIGAAFSNLFHDSNAAKAHFRNFRKNYFCSQRA